MRKELASKHQHEREQKGKAQQPMFLSNNSIHQCKEAEGIHISMLNFVWSCIRKYHLQ